MSDKNTLFPEVWAALYLKNAEGKVAAFEKDGQSHLPSWQVHGGSSWQETLDKGLKELGVTAKSSKVIAVTGNGSGHHGRVLTVFAADCSSGSLTPGNSWVSPVEPKWDEFSKKVVSHHLETPTQVWID